MGDDDELLIFAFQNENAMIANENWQKNRDILRNDVVTWLQTMQFNFRRNTKSSTEIDYICLSYKLYHTPFNAQQNNSLESDSVASRTGKV